VVDVFTKGTISEVATRRSEFSAILNEQGADALIQAIEGKIKREKTG
jgi:phospholipid transport system substrate-binding protein